MRIAFLGLMGAPMARNLLADLHRDLIAADGDPDRSALMLESEQRNPAPQRGPTT
jgi:3-hydroxyisobutyrate dehydrogenase-like beta-hydroxyacid dehydrogenase